MHVYTGFLLGFGDGIRDFGRMGAQEIFRIRDVLGDGHAAVGAAAGAVRAVARVIPIGICGYPHCVHRYCSKGANGANKPFSDHIPEGRIGRLRS